MTNWLSLIGKSTIGPDTRCDLNDLRAHLAVACPGVDDVIPVLPGGRRHGGRNDGGSQQIFHQLS